MIDLYINLYVNEIALNEFMFGNTSSIYGYTKPTKGLEDTVHLTVPLGKIYKTEVEGEFEIKRTFALYEGDF